MKRIVCIAFFLLFPAFLTFAQSEQAGELYTRTVLMDIETSGFHELSDWCGRLGLEKDGSAGELRQRLYSHYGVKPDSPGTSETKTDSREITIEKAENMKYFTIERVDENYAKISGDVYLKLFDEAKNETHVIRADTILFNFKENYLTATGNIQYQLEGETKTENFRGEKLTFNIDNSEGLFDKGITEQEKTVNDQDIVFYFKGDLINKTKENYVLLEDGRITSCDSDDPHYTIKATKIWLLTSNEWAIANGVVYIGRLPIFYFPAFLYGGDDIFFNPVFGYRSDFGNYLQTTTYLIGQKEEDEDTAFSFMQTAREDDYFKYEGLYLTEDENPSDKSRALQDYGRNSTNFLKVIFDYYTYLGIYSAIDLKLGTPKGKETEAFPDFINSFLSVFTNTELYLSIARTRYIENTANLISGLFPDENGIYSSIWQDSYFLKTIVPFRYGIDYSTTFDVEWLNFNIDINMYSEPSYTEDFSNRGENLDILSFLDPESTTGNSGSKTSSLDWSAVLDITPNMTAIEPWVNKFTINAETGLGFSSDTDNTFFYPDNFEQIITSLALGGQLLPFSSSAENDDKDGTAGGDIELRPPWDETAPPDSKKEEDSADVDSALTEPAPDIVIDLADYWSDNKTFGNNLTYSLSPKYTNRSQLSTSELTSPSDIDFNEIDYSYRTASLDGKLNYSANVYGNLFDIDNNISVAWDYKEHFNMDSLNEDTIQNYIDEDNQSSDAKITNNLTVSSTPMVYLDFLEDTKISYYFTTMIYNWDYSSDIAAYEGLFFQPTEDFISSHKISLKMPLELHGYNQTFEVSTTLPPVTMTTAGSLVLNYGISTSSFNTDFSEIDDGFAFSPLTFSEKLDFGNGNSFTNDISYNYSELYFEKNISKFNLSFFNGNLTTGADFTFDFTKNVSEYLNANIKYKFFSTTFSAKNTWNYDFNSETGWVQSAEQSFLPESLNFSIVQETDNIKLWKNRIDLKFDVNSSLNFKLIQFTDTNFSLKFGFEIEIYRFLDITFSSTSVNKSIYRYFPSYCSEIGINYINGFNDLIKSFNFFNIDDREESNFNLQSINIGLKHDLHDWDLNITYSGQPYVNDEGDYPEYNWENKLDISLKWKAIPDVKSELEIDKEGVSF